jgi:hypothetical protein
MREALRLDPRLELDPALYAPPVVRLHAEAARERRASGRSGARAAWIAAGAAAGIAAGAAAAGGGASGGPPADPPRPPVQTTLRVFNCDDECRAYVNDAPVAVVPLGQDSGLIEVGPLLLPGPNRIAFELVNRNAGIAYGFEVRRDGAIVFQEQCGLVFRVGCEDDRRFEAGVVRRFDLSLDAPAR